MLKLYVNRIFCIPLQRHINIFVMRLSTLLLSFLFCLLFACGVAAVFSLPSEPVGLALTLENDPPAQPDPDTSGRG